MKLTNVNGLPVALWTYNMLLRCPFKISTDTLDILREFHDFPQNFETNSLTFLHFVDRASRHNRVKKHQLKRNLFLVHFVNPYILRAYLGPSSGGTTVCIQQLVLIWKEDSLRLLERIYIMIINYVRTHWNPQHKSVNNSIIFYTFHYIYIYIMIINYVKTYWNPQHKFVNNSIIYYTFYYIYMYIYIYNDN